MVATLCLMVGMPKIDVNVGSLDENKLIDALDDVGNKDVIDDYNDDDDEKITM